MDPPDDTNFAGFRGRGGNDGWRENRGGDEQTLTFNNPDEGVENDAFAQKMLEQPHVTSDARPVEIDEKTLQSMRYEEVFVVDYTSLCPKMPRRYFKNMVPDVSITKCECCCKFFLQDEYEFAYIEKGHCPFCKNVEKDKGVNNVYGSLADMRQ